MPEGFVKLRRGLDEHLARMSDGGVKLYIRLLFLADWRKGKTQGLAQVVFSGIATEFGWSPRTVKYITAELKKGGYIAVERRGNQHRPSIIRIEKYDDARAKDCPTQHSAQATDCLTTGKQGQESKVVGATNCPTSCPSTFVTRFEIKRPEPPKKLEERRSSSCKNGAETKKMYDPDDKPLILTGRVWQKLGISRLSGTFQPFIDLVNRMQPGIEETVATWCSKILDGCEAEHITYPRAFLRVTREFREKQAGRCFYSLTEQIEAEHKRRNAL